MADKFKANSWIVVPAAVVTLILYIMLGIDIPQLSVGGSANPWLMIPYLLVIITAVCGLNVTLVLTIGLV